MPNYRYKAIDGAGARVSGMVEGDSPLAATEALLAQGLNATDVRPAGSESAGAFGLERLGFGVRRVSPLEVALLLRQLATLINADVPLVESLSILERQMTNQGLRSVLGKIVDQVKGGSDFSKALEQHPRVFSPMVISMTRVGETGGVLGPILDQLASITEREQQTHGEVRSAMTYPVIVMAVGALVVSSLMAFVVPKLTGIFQDMGAALPRPTVILLGASAAAKRFWWVALLVIAGAWSALRAWRSTEEGKLRFDRFVLRMPVFGALARRSAISRFARALGVLAGGGVPLLEALGVVKGVLGNAAMSQAIDRACAGLREGNSLARELAKETFLFPELVTHMIGVGENSGNLDTMLLKIAETYEWQAQQTVRTILSLIGPAMILALAVLVGFIALALILPIFSMQQMIS